MQEIKHDGSRGPETHFDEDEMKKMLEDPAVKKVRVFNRPKKILVVDNDNGLDKDKTEYEKEKAKASMQPPPGGQQSIVPEQKELQPKVPKVIPGFKLKDGMKINLHGTLYKVTAARSNGKVTMKFVRFIKNQEGEAT